MVETNIRVLRGGTDISLPIRMVHVSSTQDRVDLMELACSRLKSRLHLAAVVHPHAPDKLLVVSASPISTKTFVEDDWQLTIEDAGNHDPLSLNDSVGQ